MKKENNKVFFFFVKKIKIKICHHVKCLMHMKTQHVEIFTSAISAHSFYIEVHLGLRTLSIDQNCIYYRPWDCWTHPCMSYYLWSGWPSRTVHFLYIPNNKRTTSNSTTFIQPKQQKVDWLIPIVHFCVHPKEQKSGLLPIIHIMNIIN